MIWSICFLAVNPDLPRRISDASFIACVQMAVVGRVSPEKVEQFLDRRAIINTCTSDDWPVLKAARFRPHPTLPMPDLQMANNVVYWPRDTTTDLPEVVGVAWMQNGDLLLFLAAVLPP